MVTALYLAGNGIGDAGVEALAEALYGKTVLTALDLGSNGLGTEGVEALAGVLRDNTVLKKLGLMCNNLRDEGVEALAGVLRGNAGLTELRLEDNNSGAAGAAALVEALRGNIGLTVLDLEHNNIGDTVLDEIAAACAANQARRDAQRAADGGCAVAVRQQLAEIGFADAGADDGLLRACDYDVARVIDRLVGGGAGAAGGAPPAPPPAVAAGAAGAAAPAPALALSADAQAQAQTQVQRNSDVTGDHGILLPIKGVLRSAALGLLEAAAATRVLDIGADAWTARELRAARAADDAYGLSVDEAGALALYSMDGELYAELNRRLRAGDRSVIKPFFPYSTCGSCSWGDPSCPAIRAVCGAAWRASICVPASPRARTSSGGLELVLQGGLDADAHDAQPALVRHRWGAHAVSDRGARRRRHCAPLHLPGRGLRGRGAPLPGHQVPCRRLHRAEQRALPCPPSRGPCARAPHFVSSALSPLAE